MKSLKRKFDKLKADRSNWNSMWQILGEYVSQLKQNFEASPANGEFLSRDIYDATGTFAAHNAASALLGMLWPGSAKQSIEISPPDDLDMTTELGQFYQRMTSRLAKAMDDPKANLALSLDEFMLDQLIFGTSAIGCEKGTESKLLYKPYGVKELYVNEGKNGLVNEIYIFFEWAVERVVDEYGIDNVSQKIRDAYKADRFDEKVQILHIIAPRKEKKALKGKLAMPYMSVHMEYSNCHVLKEEGFHELPIFAVRFRKLNYELYGRSPAMNALPDIREANTLREAVIVATEKNLDPPLGVMDDGMLGGGSIDTSASAINVFNGSGNISGSNPVFPLVTVGSIPDALARLEELKQTISQHFFIDRLIDFNNDTQMTFGEAQIRDQIRSSSLSSLYSRQIAEGLTPLIQRSVNVLWREGEFGVIPDSEEEQELLAQGKEPEYIPEELVERLSQGKDVYEITYKTKAFNAARANEYISIVDIMNFAMQAMQVDPSIANRVNLHEGIKNLGNIRGLPVGILREDDEVEAMNQAQQEQQAQAAALQSAEMMAGIAEKGAKAQATARQ
jgi:hypothetical protein